MRLHPTVIALSMLVACLSTASGALASDTEFIYQGELKQAGGAANGAFDFLFSLWNAASGGGQVGEALAFNNQPVVDGRFTVALDFGAAAFDNEDRWLQIRVDGVPLDTRQPIARTPYAMQTRGLFVDDEDHVGIGTTDPAAQLHIDGTASSETTLQIDAPGAATGQILFSSPRGDPGIIGLADVGNRRDIRFMDTGLGLFTSSSASAPVSGNGIYIDEVGRVGIGTIEPVGALYVAGNGYFIASGDTAMYAESHDSFLGYGVRGETVAPNGAGVRGYARSSTGSATGVSGRSDSNAGTGVDGFADATAGDTIGVHGTVYSSAGRGVYGEAIALSGLTYGVYGESASAGGCGVYGHATRTTGINVGVYGRCDNLSGWDFFAGGAGFNYGSSSSRRWKHDIEEIDDALGRVAELRGVFFEWDEAHGGHHDVGMIAEEVGAVLPEIVTYEANGVDAVGMDYGKLTPLLVEAIKGLRAEKDAEIQALRAEKDAELAELGARLRELERRVSKEGAGR